MRYLPAYLSIDDTRYTIHTTMRSIAAATRVYAFMRASDGSSATFDIRLRTEVGWSCASCCCLCIGSSSRSCCCSRLAVAVALTVPRLRFAALFVRSLFASSFVCGSARARVAAFGSYVRLLSRKHTHAHTRTLALAIIIIAASLAYTLPLRAEYTTRCYRNFIYINLASPLVALISFPLPRRRRRCCCCFCPFSVQLDRRARSLAKGSTNMAIGHTHKHTQSEARLCACVGSSSSARTPTYFVDGPQQALKKHLTDTHTHTHTGAHTRT